MAIFQDNLKWASTRISAFWILLELRMMEVVVTAGAIDMQSFSKLSPLTKQTPAYRPDALPIIQLCQSTKD